MSSKEPVKVRGCTCAKLRSLTRMTTRHYDAYLAAAGLKLTQFSLLSALKGMGEITHSALARQIGMDRTTLTRNLRPLVAAGWVSQVPSTVDSRATALGLTPAGRQVWENAKPHWRAAQMALNSLLGDEEVAALHAMLDQSIATFSDKAPQSAP